MSRHRIFWLLSMLFLALISWSGSALAVDERTEPTAVEYRLGKLSVLGSGRVSSDILRLRGGLQLREIAHSPLFVGGEARFEQEKRLPYDLRRWGGLWTMGWQLNEPTDVVLTYRLDSYKVFNTGPNVDPAFQTVAGRSEVAALGLGLEHDTRDDRLYAARGVRLRLGSELATQWLGGDYDPGPA